MQKVTIVGLGLIGGSIGMGLKAWSNNEGKREDVLHITGFDVELEQQNYAKKLKAVDRTEWSLPSSVQGSDLIIIAVPPLAVREVMEAIAPSLNAGAVVCDVTSTKAEIMEWAKELLPDSVHFVGTHPMAGGHQSIEAASADLFRDATWCVVPSVSADETAVQTVIGMVNALGAEPIFVDAHEHDGFVAAVSHLPFMLSTVLMHSVSSDPAWRDMKQLTASGFQDVSRLAGGSARMHRDICITNREGIARWVGSAIEDLEHLQTLVRTESDEADDALLKFFEEARDARASWATAERRDGRLVQDTDDELVEMSVGGQISQMMFGSLFRRKPKVQDGKSNGDANRSRRSR